MLDSPVYKQSPISSKKLRPRHHFRYPEIIFQEKKKKKGHGRKRKTSSSSSSEWTFEIYGKIIYFLIPFFILSFFAFFCALDDCAVRGFFSSAAEGLLKRGPSFLHISYHSGVSISFLPAAKPLVLERPKLLWWWWGDRIELYIL